MFLLSKSLKRHVNIKLCICNFHDESPVMQKFLLLPEPWDLDKVCKQNNLLQQFKYGCHKDIQGGFDEKLGGEGGW